MDKGLHTRTLGRTGLQVTEVGLGGIPIIRIPFQRAVSIVHRALDLGINYLDTARAYGDSEAKIGEVMKTRRDECYLATKTTARTRQEAEEHLRTSLRELKTRRVDVWQLHDISTRPAWKRVMGKGGALEAAKAARDKKRVRFIGLSSHNIEVLREAIESSEFDMVLLVYNVAINDTADVMRLATERNVGVAVMKPLSGGRLFRLTGRRHRTTGSRRPPLRWPKGRNQITPEVAWRFVLMNPDVDVALAGAKWLKDVHQAVRMSKRWQPLTTPQVRKWTRIAAGLGKNVCWNCGYCDVCPEGIPVPSIMQIVDELRAFSYEWPRLRRAYQGLPKDVSLCTQCGRCQAACPFDLPVMERLQRAHQRLSGEV